MAFFLSLDSILMIYFQDIDSRGRLSRRFFCPASIQGPFRPSMESGSSNYWSYTFDSLYSVCNAFLSHAVRIVQAKSSKNHLHALIWYSKMTVLYKLPRVNSLAHATTECNADGFSSSFYLFFILFCVFIN